MGALGDLLFRLGSVRSWAWRKFISNDPGPQGQILRESPMGSWLSALASDPEVLSILEIGTWKGLGSTMLLHSAVAGRADSPLVQSLEADAEMHRIARGNVPNDGRVDLIYGTIVSPNELDDWELSNVEKDWFAADSNAISKAPYVLKIIPQRIDLLLLDGGEFSSFVEFRLLEKRISKWLMLDDINFRKNKKAHEFLSRDESWKLVVAGQDRHGWAVWLRLT